MRIELGRSGHFPYHLCSCARLSTSKCNRLSPVGSRRRLGPPDESTYDITLRNQTKITCIGKPKYDKDQRSWIGSRRPRKDPCGSSRVRFPHRSALRACLTNRIFIKMARREPGFLAKTLRQGEAPAASAPKTLIIQSLKPGLPEHFKRLRPGGRREKAV